MFKIEAQFELSRVNAESDDGKTWSVQFEFDGEISPTVQLNHEQMSAVMQFQLHPDGEPLHHGMLRVQLESALENIPRHLWPMP